jgi:hypothetical protein
MGHEGNENEDSQQKIELPTEVYQNTLKEIIKNNCNAAYEDCDVKIEAGSSKGDNYIGVIYRITVKPPKGKTLNIIVKLPPQNVARREQFFARPCFLRESEFYEVIYPMLAKFQAEKGIDVKGEGFSEVADCYKSLTIDQNEGLFLEDLKASGFEMFDRFKEVTKEHAMRTMEALGKYHALSFALRDQKPELLEPYKSLVDIFFQRDPESMEHIKAWFDHLKKQAYDALELFDNEDLKKRAKAQLDKDFFTMVGENIDGAAAEPYSVICHGDCWNNNIMYRYEVSSPSPKTTKASQNFSNLLPKIFSILLHNSFADARWHDVFRFSLFLDNFSPLRFLLLLARPRQLVEDDFLDFYSNSQLHCRLHHLQIRRD